ncbi:MAG: hypothetical protein V1661_01295, partial [bacterium]
MRPEIDYKIKTKDGKKQNLTSKKYFYKFFLAVIAFLFILVSPVQAGIKDFAQNKAIVVSENVQGLFLSVSKFPSLVKEGLGEVGGAVKNFTINEIYNIQNSLSSVSGAFSSMGKVVLEKVRDAGEKTSVLGANIVDSAGSASLAVAGGVKDITAGIGGGVGSVSVSLRGVLDEAISALSVIPAKAGIYSTHIASEAANGLAAIGTVITKAPQVATDSFVGVGNQMARVPQFAADAMIVSGNSFAKVPQALSTGMQATGNVLVAAPATISVIPAKAGIQTLSEKIKTLAAASQNAINNSVSQFSFTGQKSKAAPSPSRPALDAGTQESNTLSSVIASPSPVIARSEATKQSQPADVSVIDSSALSLATPSLSTPLDYISQTTGAAASAVVSFGQESAASLGEIFVEAPQTIFADSWQWLVGVGSGISNFINDTQLALLGRTVNVGPTPPPATGTQQPTPTAPAVPSTPPAPSTPGTPPSIPPAVKPAPSTPPPVTTSAKSLVLDNLSVNSNTSLKGKAVRIFAPVLLENNFTIASVFSLDSATGNLSTAGDITAAGKISGNDLAVKGSADFKGATVDFTGAKIIGLATSGG